MTTAKLSSDKLVNNQHKELLKTFYASTVPLYAQMLHLPPSDKLYGQISRQLKSIEAQIKRSIDDIR